MGATQAMGFAEAVEDGTVDLRQAIGWHFSVNHFPPVPSSMIDPAIEAIEAVRDEEPDRMIDLPEPVRYRGVDQAPAWAIVEALSSRLLPLSASR